MPLLIRLNKMKRLLLSLLISALAYNGYGQSVTLDSEWDTSAEIATAVGDETGTAGALVFNTTPTFVGDLVLTERADHASTPSAGFGYIWTKNTVPATLIFTDDAGTDFTLSPSSIDIDALTQATEADLISDANHAILVSDGGTEKYITTEDWQDFIESLSLTLSSLDITTLTTDTIDGNGAVDMDYGSGDITDHTFTTDGTGTAEIVLPAGAIDGTEILDDTIDSADYAAGSIDNEHLADSAVDTDELADDAVTLAKIAAGTDGELITWDSSGNPAAVSVGTSGQVLTSNGAGAAPSFQDAAGGSSGFDPSLEAVFYEEWYGVLGNTAGIIYAMNVWSGGGNSEAETSVINADRPGILKVTGTSNYSISGGDRTLVTGGGETTIVFSVMIDDLSDGTDDYEWRFGIMLDPPSTGDPTDGVYFIYSHDINSGKWRGITRSSSTSTNVDDTGSAVAVDTWYDLKAVINAAGTSVEFFVDNVSIGTSATNIPTNAGGPSFRLTKIAGSASINTYSDLVYVKTTLTNSRSF